MSIEEKLKELGITLPDYSKTGYPGTNYGSMKAYHRVGNVLFLSGHIPWKDGGPVFTGILGKDVTIEQGYEAARLTGINCLAGIIQAVGDLDNIVCIIRSLNFVVCTPEFTEVNKVSSGATCTSSSATSSAGGGGGVSLGPC